MSDTHAAFATARKRWRPGLGTTVGVLMVGLLLLTSFVVIFLSTRAVQHGTLTISNQLMHEVAWRTRDRVSEFLEAPRMALELAMHQVEERNLGLGTPEQLEVWLHDFMSVYTSVGSVYYGDMDGRFLMVKRKADRSLSSKQVFREPDAEGREQVWSVWRHRKPGADAQTVLESTKDLTDQYDPRLRPWYTGAMAADGLYWTDVYLFSSDGQPGISAALPHHQDGLMDGVLGLDISMRDFSAFLAGLSIGEHGRALLLDGQGRVVAGPDSPKEGPDGKPVLPPLKENAFSELSKLADEGDAWDALSRNIEQSVRYEVDGQMWIGVLTPIHIEPNTTWTVAVVTLEDDFLGEINEANRQSILITSGFVFLALVASFIVSRWILFSLKQLRTEANRIEALELDQAPLIDTPFQELFDVFEAFEGMKTGLRSFQKYMPVKLVQKLLSEKVETELGSEMMDVTIYFSDIAGFTPISEKFGPQEMAVRLGNYLSKLSHNIQDNQGLVVQYVGDEIMAFWNAPDPVENHPEQACLAALQVKPLCDSMWEGEPEMPIFHTRVGVHTARVAVGHFGSKERLYYGAVGDGVNACSRLESTNKKYGTTVIISHSTYDRVKDLFVTRMLDRVRVKGKKEGMGIYELLGKNGDVDPTLVEATNKYEQALELYFARQWDAAIALFEEAATLRPNDKAGEWLIERCHIYKADPPAEPWDGVYEMKTK